MGEEKIKRELRGELEGWLGKEFKALPQQEQDDILEIYYTRTKSRTRDPIDTIRNINDDEFNYGILILGSLYGITLSLLANVLEFFLRELFGDKGFAVFITLLFVIGSFAIIKGLEGVSRGRAKHWKLLESFQEEVKKTKA